ncbi:hypothetical protein Q2T41_18005 [Maribacter confluentis]|uniref:Uncharacterized protein n=1 Tax=Maribacter confluentis TaxID=1656093 RepID=A0ABT8RUI4_9FLAO|nr:hypothetical protein [Maribacter confluentis]MDO1514552.1 hypothetical protein [Maribacter confluentis]
MIDPGTGLTILGSAIGGAKVVEKILGPTADYVGNQIKEWTEKKVNNTSKIFQNAEKKLGAKINEPGKVPPKVLKGILQEGSWCEEELQVEYFGGVLASSRSGISRDDRGAYFVSLVTRLSTYQLRTHYLIYTAVKNHFDGQNLNIGESTDRRKMEIFIPYSTYLKGMDFTSEELANFDTLMTHSIWGLNKEELIENFSYGPADYLKTKFSDANESGIIIQPSNLGVELFMWAFGYGQKSNNEFFASETEFKTDQKIIIDKTMKTK